MYLNSPVMVIGLKYYLTSAGLDVDKEVQKGSLILSSDRTHLIKGAFDADLLLNLLEEAVDKAVHEGYRGLWASGDMTWELGHQQSMVDILEYEWRLEEVFRRRPGLSGICQYHLDTLPREAVRQGLLAHPSVFVNETLSRINPHYVQPALSNRKRPDDARLDEFINRLSQAGSPSE